MMTSQQRRNRLENLLERVQRNRQSLTGLTRKTPLAPDPEPVHEETLEESKITATDISQVRKDASQAPHQEALEEVVEEISEDDVEFVDDETDSLPSMESFDDLDRHTEDQPTRVVHTSSIFPPEAQVHKEQEEEAAKTGRFSKKRQSQEPLRKEPLSVSSSLEEAPRVFAPQPRAGTDVARVEGELRSKSYSLAAVLERAWEYGTKP